MSSRPNWSIRSADELRDFALCRVNRVINLLTDRSVKANTPQ
jgi:hypothetical protein